MSISGDERRKDHFNNNPHPGGVSIVLLPYWKADLQANQPPVQEWKSLLRDPELEWGKCCNTKLHCLFSRTMPTHTENSLENKSSQTFPAKQGLPLTAAMLCQVAHPVKWQRDTPDLSEIFKWDYCPFLPPPLAAFYRPKVITLCSSPSKKERQKNPTKPIQT